MQDDTLFTESFRDKRDTLRERFVARVGEDNGYRFDAYVDTFRTVLTPDDKSIAARIAPADGKLRKLFQICAEVMAGSMARPIPCSLASILHPTEGSIILTPALIAATADHTPQPAPPRMS